MNHASQQSQGLENRLKPMPNKNASDTIKYVELLTQAILNKEIEIKNVKKSYQKEARGIYI